MSSPQKSGFEKWQDGINKAANNANWNVLDCEIQTAVNEYNRHLSGTPGFIALDWQLIKAMVWVETGAESPKWTSNPMQIGNPGDPGLSALLTGDEGGELIIPPAWKSRLTIGTATTIPSHNIRAGIGYLLMRLATYSIKSVPDVDNFVYELKVRPGDSIAKIAKENNSTIETIKTLNPGVHTLKIGQVLKYQKASMKKVVTGWNRITTSIIAEKYNVGDPLYSRKLDYCLLIIRKIKIPTCA